ncbi:EAL domain-containing response regulator [Rhabdothermincola sediminis]|uniref:EAL domain-containing response regulator n=1 Tax=Rhabdothermincola sediminis TaxID=2751370 RepID=UPI001AA07E89|nr:EAL domain-containing response regulator [Rhabdothermincola sediminis]
MSLAACRPAAGEDATCQARIVIVDDEPTNVLVLKRMLQRAGYPHVDGLTDPRVLLNNLDRLEPDLLVLDLHMPIIDGITFLDELTRRLDDDDFVPVLVVTADVTEQAKETALAHGAHDFLTKPINYTELALRVRNLLRTRMQHVALSRERQMLASKVDHLEHGEHEQAEARRQLAQRIEAIIDSRSIEIVFQPIVDLTTAAIIGAEALARFTTTPVRPPDEWLADAAHVGLRTHLELAAIAEAVERAAALPEGAFVAVNASPSALRSPRLLRELQSFDPARVIVEVTEHERADDPEALRDAATRLRQIGARVAVDDAGAGVASLERILWLEPDVLKLERQLISDVDRSPVKRSLISALVHFCSETDSTLIAEGIETLEELHTLRSLGLRAGQGFFIGRAAPLPLRPPAMRHLWIGG